MLLLPLCCRCSLTGAPPPPPLHAAPAHTLPIDITALRVAVEVEGLTNNACVVRFAPTNLTAVKRAIRENEIKRFTEMTDAQLDAAVTRLRVTTTNMDIGRTHVLGHFNYLEYKRGRARRFSKARVDACISRLNPNRRFYQTNATGRGPYLTNGPGERFCLDGNEKLQFVKIFISGGADAFSRLVPYYDVSTNKRPETVLARRLINRRICIYNVCFRF